MSYRRHRNCFTWVENFERAQELMKEQLRVPWVQLFSGVRPSLHPMFPEIIRYPDRSSNSPSAVNGCQQQVA